MSQWKKSSTQKKQGKIQSNLTKQLFLNKKDDATQDMQLFQDQNQQLMGSILQMQQEQQYQKSIQESANLKQQSNNNLKELKSQSNNNGFQNIEEEYKYIQPVPEVFFIEKKKKKIKQKGLSEGEKKILSPEELNLLIVILKKLLKIEIGKNQNYKKERDEYEKKMIDLNQKIKNFKDKEIKLRLLKRLEDRKVLTINFNLEELDQKINTVDQALNVVLEQNDLNDFVSKTQESNNALESNVTQNLKCSKDLRNKMDLIRRALTKLNSQTNNIAKGSKGQKADSYFLGEGSSGIKLSPKSVLVLSLIFIGSVVVLHFLDKIKFS